MKTTIEFDNDDLDDANALKLALKGRDMALLLFDYKNLLRTLIKYPEENSTLHADTLEHIRDKLQELMEEYEVNLDTLLM